MSQFVDDDVSASSVAPNPPKRKRKVSKLTSDVWDDFDRKEIDEDTIDAQCRTCSKILTGISKNGTTHLRNHRNRCRRKNNIELGVKKHVFSQIESRKDLASMIVLHEYPLSLVEHVGFKKFVAGLNPDFKSVSRNTIKKDIFKIYDFEKDKTTKLLESVGRVAITMDMWSAKPTKKGYMAVTAHFIDDKWKLQNRVLKFAYVPVPHNSESLSGVLLESLYLWKIERKISAITVDNATTNDAMIDIILDTLPMHNFLLNGKLLHMRCCAHILNLIVKDGLAVIGTKIERIRSSCVFWTTTQSRIEMFESVVKQLHLSINKGLELDVKTRWNSTYHMLNRALLFKNVFSILKLREKNYNCLPTEEDWILAEEICDKLKVFNDVTNVFSGTNYPTSNCYFPRICGIKLELMKWVDSHSEDIRKMASKMVDKCEKYWKDCNLMMAIACILDPRYKMKIVEFYFRQIYDDESEFEIEKVRQGCYDLFSEYQSNVDVSTNSNFRSPFSGGVGLDDSLASFDKYVNESRLSSTSELDLYLKDQPISRQIELDILKWWDAQKSFPILQKMARDLFAVQVSTVASESTFSASGRLISPHRSRLQNDTLEALMCARSWMWSDVNDSNVSVDSNFLATFVEEEDELVDDTEY